MTREDIDKHGSKDVHHRSPRIHIGTDVYEDMLATHAVRSYATEQGVDINQVKVEFDLMQGSGKHGRILKEDIQTHKASSQDSSKRPAATSVKAAVGDQVVQMNQIMQGMVKSMNHAATVPHFYLKDEIDITQLVFLRLTRWN